MRDLEQSYITKKKAARIGAGTIALVGISSVFAAYEVTQFVNQFPMYNVKDMGGQEILDQIVDSPAYGIYEKAMKPFSMLMGGLESVLGDDVYAIPFLGTYWAAIKTSNMYKDNTINPRLKELGWMDENGNILRDKEEVS